jgi:signal transduction histidine kinase
VTPYLVTRRDRLANALLGPALLLPLALVVVILAHARRTEHVQRDVAERALDHYAAVATWQLAARIGTEYHNLAQAALSDIVEEAHDHRGGPLRADTTKCDCIDGLEARVRFRYVPATGSLEILRGRPDSATRAVLLRIARAEAASSESEPHRVVFDSSGGSRALSLFVRRAPSVMIDGLESAPDPYRRVVERILASQPLLPPQLLAPPYTGRELAVRVTDTAGVEIYANDGSFLSGRAATDSVPRLTRLRVEVAIAPAVAEALIIGGFPRSRTAPLLGLLAVATLLAGAAFVQHRRARELTRMRTEFIASVSHELRTPLTQISMFGETLMLGRERSDAERRHFASIIHRESSRLASLVDNVMRFTRGAADRFTLRLETRRLSDEITGVLAAFQPIADAAEARITTELDTELSARIDVGAFRQIVINLLDNAVKYGPPGQHIELSLTGEDGQAVLTVADGGPGIPETDRARIFDPFVRLESSSRRVAGTGIGLAVVRELVTALGGSIVVTGAAGRGALFTVRLPGARGMSRDHKSGPSSRPSVDA